MTSETWKSKFLPDPKGGAETEQLEERLTDTLNDLAETCEELLGTQCDEHLRASCKFCAETSKLSQFKR